MHLTMRQLHRCLPMVMLAVFAPSLGAEQQGPRFPVGSVGEQASAHAVPKPLLAAMGSFAPVALRRAEEGAVDELDAMSRHNSQGKEPRQVGINRRLPEPIVVQVSLAQRVPPGATADGLGVFAGSDTGAWTWGTRVRVPGAGRIRLHLAGVELPAGTRLWVWGAQEAPRSFGLELMDYSHELWTPSVGGETIALALDVPSKATGEARWSIRDLAEVPSGEGGLRPGGAKPDAGGCLIDANCSSDGDVAIAQASSAHLQFVMNGGDYVCSGNLLNPKASPAPPYLLTANHCFSTQGEASSLEAFWDFQTAFCGDSFPGNIDLSSLPRSNGARLLATSLDSDFTFVQLNSIPTGRALLGWTTAPVSDDDLVSRVSYPVAGNVQYPQTYSQSQVDNDPPTFQCGDSGGRPLSDLSKFIYSDLGQGGIYGGSSGSVGYIAGGYAVGQLFGFCYSPPVPDGCNTAGYSEIDGAFADTYSSISQYLSPGPSGQCIPSATTLCIDDQPGDQRFEVQVQFSTSSGGGLSGPGNSISLSGLGVTHGGLYWFFSSDNPELLIKVINGCGLNNKFWIFFAGTTNVGLTIVVTDTQSGHLVSYTSPDQVALATVQDTSALPCP